MAEKLWTLTDVAFYLGLREREVQRHVDANTIPYCRIGRVLRFRPSAIDAWVESHQNSELFPARIPAPASEKSGDETSRDDTTAPIIPLRKGRRTYIQPHLHQAER